MSKKQELLELARTYKTSVEEIEKSAALEIENVLDCLIIRKDIAHVLGNEMPDDKEAIKLIAETDNALRGLEVPVKNHEIVKAWQEILDLSAESWWWQPTQEQRWAWLLKPLSITLFAIAVSLIATDIAPRFLSDGPDTLSAVAVIIQTLLTLLVAGGVLTKTGQEAMERILKRWKWSHNRIPVIGVILTSILLLGILAIRIWLVPLSANFFYQRGLSFHCNGHLASAQSDYNRALKLNPELTAVHFNLGVLLEELGNFDQAKVEYQIAVKAGHILAHNRLARLHLVNEEYAVAIPLLQNAMKELKLQQETISFIKCERSNEDIPQDQLRQQVSVEELEYIILTNIGWAHLGLKQFDKAQSQLKQVIDDFPDNYDYAPTHCLLAQVLDKKGEIRDALDEYFLCISLLPNTEDPVELAWSAMAEVRINELRDKVLKK